MSVRKYGVKLGLTATAAAGLALGALAPAMASTYSSAASQGDYTYKNVAPAATDVVGVGSDTIQFVDADLASAYNSINPTGPHLASYGACTTPTAGAMTPCTNDKGNITVGGVSFVRPDGSGAGMKSLYGATDQPTVAFARSSSALDDAGVAAGLVAYPFAQDSVVMVTAKSTHAPASLSIADIVKIYNGTYTHWNEIPGNASGSTEEIVPLKPQSGSGTLKFFDAQLKAANSNTDADIVGKDTLGGVAVQEHDPTLINGNPNVIAPFSLGRAGFNADKVSVEAGWQADRAVYNVLRSKDAGNTGKADKPAWFAGSPLMDSIFGETGFFCSPMARPIIEKAGFSQLKSVTDGGKCGVGITTTSAPTLNVYPTAYRSAASQGDFVPAGLTASDLVGVGSDTIQFVDADVAAAYNASLKAGDPKLASYGACTTPTAGAMTPCTNDKGNITVGGVSFVRPDGSGAGMKSLYGATDQPTVAFARSSSALDDAGVAAGLVAYPFAQDSVVMVTAKSTHAPASLSIADIVKIYNGTYTHWNEIPGNASGSTEEIVPLKPQSGSGTLKFFDAQLKAANSNTDADIVGKDTLGGVAVQEHDPTLINGNPNVIAPFSLGRAGFNADKVSVEAGWQADRAVYNVLRSKDAGNTGKADKPAWFAGSPLMDSIFGETGFFCSPMARPIIEKAGFSQLKSVTDGGKCGVGITTTSAPALSVYNTATYTTTWVPASTGPSEECTDATTAAVSAQSAYDAAAAKVVPAQTKASAAAKAVASAKSALTAANAKVTSATKTVNAKKAAVTKAKKAVKKAKHKSKKAKTKAKKQLTKAAKALRAANTALTTAKRAQATAGSTYAAAAKASTAATNAYRSAVKDRDTKKAALTAANAAKDAACAA